MMKPETLFRTNTVRPFLNKLRNTHVQPIQQLSIVGDPDFVLCIHGRFVGLELKAQGKKPRPLQDYKLQRIKETGGVRLVASPDNWKEIKTILSNMDREKEIAWSL